MKIYNFELNIFIMNVAEIKSNIINEISLIEDLKKLEDITEFLGIGMSKQEVHIFSSEQRIRILNTLKQVENGNVITNEEAEKDIQKWLE
jgi:hypothetical protein